MGKIKIGLFGGLGTLGRETILELQKNANSNLYIFYRIGQKLELNADKSIRFISYESIVDLSMKLNKFSLDIIVDMIGSYSFGNINTVSRDKITKLVEDNYIFHANLISVYANSKKLYLPKLIIITSSSVGKINAEQPLYNSLKTGLSHLIKCINSGLPKHKQIIEYRPRSFKSDIYKKAQSKIPQELYSSFKEPIYYAKRLNNLINKLLQ